MKYAVITGSTGGIGSEVANLLAAQGWSLVLLNRSEEEGQKQKIKLSTKYPNQEFIAYKTNLMATNEIYEVIEKIKKSNINLQMLYNVAGILTDKKVMNSDGYESHFVVNTLAPYILINGLSESLKKGSSAERKSVIINFSTSAIKSLKSLDISTLTNPEAIGGLMGAYAKSKLALDVTTCFLKDELLEKGILIQSVDPGATKSPMTSKKDGMPWFIRLLQPIMFKSPQTQAKKLVDAVEKAVSKSETGLLISEGKTKKMSPLAQNRENQIELRSLLDSILK